MKLRLYKVATSTIVYSSRLPYFIYRLGTDKQTVATLANVPIEDVTELENEIVIHLTIDDFNKTEGIRG